MARIVITGSSGRIGRAVFWQAVREHEVIGIDLQPSSSTTNIANISQPDVLKRAFVGADAVIHTAALHAPHVGVRSEPEFEKTNVESTALVAQIANTSGVRNLVFSSTTALYGYANQKDEEAVWVDEHTVPQPRTIYHRTKFAAEETLKAEASSAMSIAIIRLSRCFPEPVPEMAIYRLHRGVDYRDVATAHLQAASLGECGVHTFVVSGSTPFMRTDCERLKFDAPSVIWERAPEVAQEFDQRGWPLPKSIDRVYDSSFVSRKLGWKMKFGSDHLFKQYDVMDFEVLPPEAQIQSEE